MGGLSFFEKKGSGVEKKGDEREELQGEEGGEAVIGM